MTSNRYIVASSQEWHEKGFSNFIKYSNKEWYFFSKRKDLMNSVELLQPKYIFFLHWRWLVPADIVAQFECICFHMTDVPYGRGGSPLQNLIVRGHKKTMLTALRMVEELDAGPVYCKLPLSLQGDAQDIYLRAGNISWQIIRWIVDNQPEPTPQIGEPVFFKRRKPEQSLIPENVSMESFYDYIRMLDAEGYPKAYIDFEDFRLEFSNAELKSESLLANVKITYKDKDND